ncbi:aspartate aminotransferase family protein [candidate division KSB1 bacterium]
MVSERSTERSRELRTLRDKYVPNCLVNVTPVIAGTASGSWITDVDGRKYLDFGAGIAVTSAGNCHPEVVEAVKSQAERSFHTCFHIVMQENYIKLAQRLSDMIPGDSQTKVMFLNSGAEAVENVIKLARVFTKRRSFIAPEYGFHGRTYGALALTSKTRPLKSGLEPFMPEVYRMPYAYCYRCSLKLSYPDCAMACIEHVERMFTTTVAADSVAGIVVEPVLGEGGVVVPPKEYLDGLRALCDRYGILLIFDEIQTAFGRVGSWFAAEHFNVCPDIMTLAKALGNGMPIAAVAGRQDIMDTPVPGALGSTYGGNPLAVASSLAMLDVLEKEQLPQRAKTLGARMLNHFKLLEEKYEWVGEVRGIGMMFGIELVKDRTTKEPDKEKATRVIAGCVEEGLIVTRAGAHGNIIRIVPPLTTDEKDIDTGMEIIDSIFGNIDGG